MRYNKRANIVVISAKIEQMKRYGVVIFFILSACASPPIYKIEPVITFSSISRTEIDQNDSVRIRVEFTDGDGDLGYDSQDTLCKSLCNVDSCLGGGRTLFLLDNRLPNCLGEVYQVPFIPPKGSSDAISGSIEVVKSRICCLKPPLGSQCSRNLINPLDTVIYSIFLIDRAGHFSDTVELPPIVIHCDRVVE